jgi:hypothetical protein
MGFKDLKGKLYPIVGLKKKEDHIMANFGQRPFEFDIDGYMRVSFLLSLSHLPGSLLLFFYAYTGSGESTAPKGAASEVSKSWETPSEAASACCDCRCSYPRTLIHHPGSIS